MRVVVSERVWESHHSVCETTTHVDGRWVEGDSGGLDVICLGDEDAKFFWQESAAHYTEKWGRPAIPFACFEANIWQFWDAGDVGLLTPHANGVATHMIVVPHESMVEDVIMEAIRRFDQDCWWYAV